MPRLEKQPILYQNKLDIPEKYLRFATPEEVAVYRAEKIKCGNITEIGAGIGGQTLAFSKTCKQVLAIESDKKKAGILIQNLKKLNINNVKVLVADALSKKAIEEIKEFQPDIIFCDTERPESGERKISSIKPPIKEILKVFSEIKKIAVEIPPFTDTNELKEKPEKEFLSLNSQLNRLTLYFNELKNADVSVVSLPSREKLESKIPRPKIKKISSIKEFEYLSAVNPAVVIANLVSELAEKFNASVLELNKPVLLSNKPARTDFLTGYKIKTICKNEQKEIKEKLGGLGAGKVILRYNIDPKDYWKIRNFYEKELKGNTEITLFINEEKSEAILCERIN